jgi:antitoxin HigA-1
MIESFRHKGLERLFREDNRKGLPQDMIARIRDMLVAIDHAAVIDDLALPTFLGGDCSCQLANRLQFRERFRIRSRFRRLSLKETSAMPMKNPPHPGSLVKGELDELGVSVAEAAVALGVTRQQLYRVIRGENAISPDMALRLEKAIGSTADFWLRLQMGYDLAQARMREPAVKVTKLEPKAA